MVKKFSKYIQQTLLFYITFRTNHFKTKFAITNASLEPAISTAILDHILQLNSHINLNKIQQF